jgi:L-amino acid N-acyltransferase YncA
MPVTIAHCDESHKDGILEILNDAILHTTAIYDYEPRKMESMQAWFEAKRKGSFPVLGAFDLDHNLVGFGTYGTFRNWPAYKYSIEHSVYVRKEAQGMGVGKRILSELCREAESQGFHNLVAGIDSENHVSIHLHEKMGFTYSGRIKHAGYKFGRWLDLVFMQKLLPAPPNPEDG